MITLKAQGSFTKTGNFLERILKLDLKHALEEYGVLGCLELQRATPKRTGKTANSWRYDVTITGDGGTVAWYNTNVNEGVPIAIIIEYGHGTGWGGYVPPQPYIKQALSGIFDALSEKVWEEVVS